MTIPLSEVRVLDRNAESIGVSIDALVRNAARAIVARVKEMAPSGEIVVLAGPGNNGADGMAAARLLEAGGRDVRVLTPAPPDGWKTRAAREAASDVDVEHEPTTAHVEEACEGAGVVVDALLGAGVHGTLREPYASWVGVLARHAGRTLAVDVPTGFGTTPTYVPTETVTFHETKEGMTEASCGRVTVADIGLPRDAWLYTGPGEYLLYPPGRADQHKGEGGIVLVIGGGPYTGAPAVSAMAALRAGADLSIVLTPQRAWSVVASYSPNVVARPLVGDDVNFDDPSNRVTLNTWLKKAHSVVLGPGLGLMSQTQKAVHHVIERAHKEHVPCVVDADAITSIADDPKLVAQAALVTPHAKDFQNLTGQALPDDPIERGEVARTAAAKLGGTWLVKGPVDVITDGARVKLNATGHAAMSVGGTGDALAGLAGALLAKGLGPFDAARLAARIMGEAGEATYAHLGWGLVATDVVDAVAPVLARRLSKPADLKRGIQ